MGESSGWKVPKVRWRDGIPRAWHLPLSLVLGALLWGASLPPYGWPILSVAAFVPPLMALPGTSPLRALAWGWAGGFLWEAATLWWLVPTLTRYGEMGWPLAVVLVAGLCGVLGMYMALFWGFLAFADRRMGWTSLALAPMAWVLAEWLRGHLFGGLPWWGPGYALSVYPLLLQATSLVGVLGLSLLAVMVSTALAMGVRDRRSPATLAVGLCAVLLFAGASLFGLSRLDWKTEPSERVRVGYIQPQVPQDQKWDATLAVEVERRFIDLSAPFRLYRLRLLVWPESCTPNLWDGDEVFRSEVEDLARDLSCSILLGTVFRTPAGELQNGAVMVLPDGAEGGRYAKTHLVPFGEYVPFRGLLGFAKPIVETVGDFEPGASLDPMPSPAGRLGVNICYEGIFPGLVREQVRRGAEVLVNITNDAWYEGTPGPAQHFFIQRVRAVETARYLIRSANGGVSGVVNPRGQLEAATPKGEPASFWGEIVPQRGVTPYVRLGDTWLIALLAFLGLALAFLRESNRSCDEETEP